MKVLPSTLILAGVLLQQGTAGGEIPPMIYGFPATREAPVWVSADAAVLDGSLRWELFSEFEARLLREGLARAEDRRATWSLGTSDSGCTFEVRVHGDYWGDAGDTSLEGVYRASEFGISGSVTSIEQGFHRGHPGSLVEVEVETTLKPEAGAWDGKTVFVSYPHARISTAEGVFCAGRWRDGKPPVVGARILVFSFREVPRDEIPIVDPMDQEIIFEDEQGFLSLPEGQPKGAETWEELAERLRRLADPRRPGAPRFR